jgi:hypothetical protein
MRTRAQPREDTESPLEPPIIVVGDGQVELYRSTSRVAADVEAVDAELFRGYDSKGRPVRISGEFKQGKWWFGLGWVSNGPVTVEAISDQPTHAEELRIALRDWWMRTGGAANAKAAASRENATLEELIIAIAARDGIN